MSNTENKNTTISIQIISASLTMITVTGAFAVFIIEKRDIGFWYYLIAGSAFFCFVISIFLGGKGLSVKAEKSPKSYFNWQAITALFGIVLFCMSVFLGKEKSNNIETKINEQEKIIIELKIKDEFREKEIQRLIDDLNKLAKQIDEMNTMPNKHIGN